MLLGLSIYQSSPIDLSHVSPQTLEVNRRLNCCTEVLLESWDQLEDVDSHKDGLLYGVPVSIKENIGYKVVLIRCFIALFPCT